ncbi:ectoine/hydroxyectoine ABC transporter permease subunit EhuD [Falsiroseomonas oryzae]|uniref:ectoine/hydroxyectoine ABC transporter permease subunit EhuD n=1 Tax=Falsiroseomonas oryzae TaxID=2766473 RepID=UPI0022EA535C|nr:ectoine/hydroxyectoine ABC transporter permease subunit EhuD [Roseomonas sp. MO-31]
MLPAADPDLLFDPAFAAAILPLLLDAALVTVGATFAAFALAAVLALPLALAAGAAPAALFLPARALGLAIRGTPILVQLYFVYFSLPLLGVVLPALLAGVLVLGVHYAAYLAEVYRAGLASVGKGVREAALALGLRPMQAFRLVVVPLALRAALPAAGNLLIALFKETPVLSAVAILELMQTAKLLGSETFRYTEPLTLVGVIFLALSLGSSALLRRLEARLARG